MDDVLILQVLIPTVMKLKSEIELSDALCVRII
jgi:hypothetical protein